MTVIKEDFQVFIGDIIDFSDSYTGMGKVMQFVYKVKVQHHNSDSKNLNKL